MGIVSHPTIRSIGSSDHLLTSAFGGMVAFCIIVGDTIPHVFAAIFPSLPNTSFLWLLTDRRAIIIIFILGISFPLSLYRDIAKVALNFQMAFEDNAKTSQLAKASTLALVSMLIIIVTVLTQGPRVPSDLKGKLRGSILINSGIFQAIGVISFGNALLPAPWICADCKCE